MLENRSAPVQDEKAERNKHRGSGAGWCDPVVEGEVGGIRNVEGSGKDFFLPGKAGLGENFSTGVDVLGNA